MMNLKSDMIIDASLVIGNAGDQSRDFFFEGKDEFHEKKAALFLPAANILA